jgi:hypothetical protein
MKNSHAAGEDSMGQRFRSPTVATEARSVDFPDSDQVVRVTVKAPQTRNEPSLLRQRNRFLVEQNGTLIRWSRVRVPPRSFTTAQVRTRMEAHRFLS